MSEPVHTSETPATGAPEQPQVTVTLDHGEQQFVDGMKAADPTSESKPTETVDYWKQRARQHEDRAKEQAAKLAAKLKEIEDRDLSELQKAQRDREEALTQLQETQREALRNRVALTKGLPADIAATLNGSTEEELTAHADALLAWRGNTPPPTPRPDPAQGPRPTSPEADADAEYQRFFPDEARR